MLSHHIDIMGKALSQLLITLGVLIAGLPLTVAAAAAGDAFRVALVLTGSIADGGWNQQA